MALVFVIALPLIILVGFNKPYTLTASQDIVQMRFWSLKIHRTDEFDLFLVGDSRTYSVLSPAAMQTILPDLRILNFGFSSGGLNPEIYALVEQRLATDGPHPMIVLGITSISLPPAAVKNEQYNQ